MGSFETTSDVEAWARQHGGLAAVNEALARGTFGTNPQSIRTAIRYVEREELKITQRLELENRRQHAIDAAEKYARAAERSAAAARRSFWVAIAAAAVALGAAAMVILTVRLPY